MRSESSGSLSVTLPEWWVTYLPLSPAWFTLLSTVNYPAYSAVDTGFLEEGDFFSLPTVKITEFTPPYTVPFADQ